MPATVSTDDIPRLTNLTKVFWPEEGYTKLDLLTYYQQIAPVILPHLRDRPQAMCRRPDGWQGKEFYQLTSKQQPAWLPTARIPVEQGRKTKRFVLCQDLRTLIWLVNFGCIDLNPWAVRAGNLDRPDFLIIDLDPDNVPFDRVVEVAQEVLRMLDKLGAENYCKTSGKRGLHIYAPIGAKYDAWQAHTFAKLVCIFVNNRLPNITTTDPRMDRRKGGIYLDHTRSGRGQAVASAYSVRAWPGATVSTPLKWPEVRRGLDPGKFTIRTTAERIAKVGDLWAPVLGPGIDLAKCLARVERVEKIHRIEDL
jgi:bifunctional non-homologous end joining protein LigD